MVNENCGNCRMKIYDISCGGCVDGSKCRKCYGLPTNADRIRHSTDEELREFMCSITKCEVCVYECWGGCKLLDWLKQPVDVSDEK